MLQNTFVTYTAQPCGVLQCKRDWRCRNYSTRTQTTVAMHSLSHYNRGNLKLQRSHRCFGDWLHLISFLHGHSCCGQIYAFAILLPFYSDGFNCTSMGLFEKLLLSHCVGQDTDALVAGPSRFRRLYYSSWKTWSPFNWLCDFLNQLVAQVMI